jgi:hypothetical protein
MVVWYNMSDEPLPMMQGKFPEIKKMSVKQKNSEIEAWRNLWSFTPSEVKYYLLKSGSQVGITMRNYKRYLGVLLSTHWIIDEVEMGIFEKVYDQNTGEYFFETKIIKLNPKSVIDIQWIQQRISEKDAGVPETTEPPPPEQPEEEVPSNDV